MRAQKYMASLDFRADPLHLNGMSQISVTCGFEEVERPQVAALYWEAFSAKLGRVMGPAERAHGFFARTMSPDYCLVARDEGGQMLGLAGFKTGEGSLTGAGLRDMLHHYGAFGGLWRGMLLSVLERDLESGVLLMDGICVTENARGRGVGTALLEGIEGVARDRACPRLRLDVIDTNPRARALYERRGFQQVGEESTGPFRYLFGFDSATRMEKTLT